MLFRSPASRPGDQEMGSVCVSVCVSLTALCLLSLSFPVLECNLTICESEVPPCENGNHLVIGYSALSCCPEYRCAGSGVCVCTAGNRESSQTTTAQSQNFLPHSLSFRQPPLSLPFSLSLDSPPSLSLPLSLFRSLSPEIGRASCRERVSSPV